MTVVHPATLSHIVRYPDFGDAPFHIPGDAP